MGRVFGDSVIVISTQHPMRRSVALGLPKTLNFTLKGEAKEEGKLLWALSRGSMSAESFVELPAPECTICLLDKVAGEIVEASYESDAVGRDLVGCSQLWVELNGCSDASVRAIALNSKSGRRHSQ